MGQMKTILTLLTIFIVPTVSFHLPPSIISQSSILMHPNAKNISPHPYHITRSINFNPQYSLSTSLKSSNSPVTPLPPPLTAPSEPIPFSVCPITPLLSTTTLVVISELFKSLFQRYNLTSSFPPSLAACLTLLSTFFLIDYLTPPSSKHSGETLLYHYFVPGGDLLAKWLPLFFVPSLVTLPLIVMPGKSDLIRLGVLVPLGFIASLLSTVVFVSVVRLMKFSKVRLEGRAKQSELPINFPEEQQHSRPLPLSIAHNSLSCLITNPNSTRRFAPCQ